MSKLDIVHRLRARADIFEESPSGFAMALVNLPQALREAADEIEDLRDVARGLLDVAAGRVVSIDEVDRVLAERDK